MFRTNLNAPTKGRVFDLSIVMQGWNLTASEPYRLVASAINGDPRESVGDIFAIGDAEYLVPEKRTRGQDGQLVANDIRLDQAKAIINRPNGTRQIGEMTFGTDIPASDWSVLSQAVEAWNQPKAGYAVQIFRPQL